MYKNILRTLEAEILKAFLEHSTSAQNLNDLFI